MKVSADTNVLVRMLIEDDEMQAAAVKKVFRKAEMIVASCPALCEVVWILRSVYKLRRDDIASALRTLLDTENLVFDRKPVYTGLATLEAGGDFADGVIAAESERLGGETFLSFDKKAVSLLASQGYATRLL